MSSIPEPWATRMVERNFTDRRAVNGGPSISALAEACGASTTTISNAIFGRTATKPEVIRALIRELGEDVKGWLGIDVFRDWAPPEESALLTDRQRKAVAEIIRAMTERQDRTDGAPIVEVTAPAVQLNLPRQADRSPAQGSDPV